MVPKIHSYRSFKISKSKWLGMRLKFTHLVEEKDTNRVKMKWMKFTNLPILPSNF